MRRLCMIALLLGGCGGVERPEAASQDPDDVPMTEADVEMPQSYAAAVLRIKNNRDAIRAALEADTPSKAHRALDEVDIVLDKLPSIAKSNGIPIEQWETINLSAQQLRDAFDQLHSAIDRKQEPNYKAVAQAIDQAIDNLERVTR